MTKALTFTAVFQAQSLNYGEGIGNISELKKFHRGNGDVYTFASRQSIRYDIVRLGNELFGWNLETVEKVGGGVVQFRKNASIAESVEMDLFGYLKTDKVSQKRAAVARLSHAIALEPYKSDMEFLNNMGLADRIPSTPNLANIEQHLTYYTYTLTLDLDRVGIDKGNHDGEVRISEEERYQRVLQLLEIMKVLYRDIRGRRENCAPLFAVGGVYSVSNPFFLGRVRLANNKNGMGIDVGALSSVMNTTFMGQSIAPATKVGFVDGVWANEYDLRDQFGDRALSMESFFQELQAQVRHAYGVE
ncbi:type I-B CRISPR-associated protein Cas7/Cst2/DevR [Paenibacillus sp. SC116]|uniref:type I-B CRISPR-associated protein Cas7/Cst2/DevR n=1 Tax=Paenibacillus sp. SC116 TaxID=2968986 RepID=UPI00215AA052|nr:type I-B CRISPR-associated protein Cas7/Cst2/DevR [Paenibacillus sp. SC116]MCR8844106.1 type I-B CRISPR-associated protein Cas7/Cst2/DevR [Paenibacillus sp. SC116]